ncbi:MAG TPA: hypothetical protein VGA37_06375 [Gemmatimonadales bacterium]
MGYRKFVDREGRGWNVKDRSPSAWRFEPEPGNPSPAVDVEAPGYQKDPFELSNEELQKLLDAVAGRAARPSPRRKGSPFLDG